VAPVFTQPYMDDGDLENDFRIFQHKFTKRADPGGLHLHITHARTTYVSSNFSNSLRHKQKRLDPFVIYNVTENFNCRSGDGLAAKGLLLSDDKCCQAIKSDLSGTIKLRRNPPEVRVTSGQKPSTKVIYIVLQTSVRLF